MPFEDAGALPPHPRPNFGDRGKIRTAGRVRKEGVGGSALVPSSPVIASDYQTAPRGTRRKACLAPLNTARTGQVLPDEEMPTSPHFKCRHEGRREIRTSVKSSVRQLLI